MKRIIILIMLLMPLTGMANEIPIKQLFEKYLNKPGFTSVELSKEILQTNGVAGIDSMIALSTEDGSAIPTFTAEVTQHTAELKRIMSMVSDGKNVSIHSKSDSSGKLNYLVMFSHSDSSAVLIMLIGPDIKIEKAMSLIGKGKK